MKKTFSVLVMTAIMLSVFFCTPVFADTVDVPQVLTAYATGSSPSYEILVYLTRMAVDTNVEFDDTAHSSPVYESQKYHLVVICKSGHNKPLFMSGIKIKFSANESEYNVNQITNVENTGGELYLYNQGTSSLTLAGYADYGFGNAAFRVDPYGTLVCDCIIETKIAPSASSAIIGYITGVSFDGTPNVRESTSYGDNSQWNIKDRLDKIISFLAGNSSSTGNVSSDSNTLKNQSDQVHSQEASYYAQNSQAIANTGLSNYQFDNNSVSGLQGVRGDFVDVWNSLGGWNAVYIFSLTLGLALTILRHSPSAISSAIKRKRYNNNE